MRRERKRGVGLEKGKRIGNGERSGKEGVGVRKRIEERRNEERRGWGGIKKNEN